MFTLRTHIFDIKSRKPVELVTPISQSEPGQMKLCSILLVEGGMLRVADIFVNHHGLVSVEDSLAKIKWPISIIPEAHSIENLPRNLIDAAGVAS